MKSWTPRAIYESKPWLFVVLGVILAIGSLLWSFIVGNWTWWRSLSCFVGAALAMIGGVTLQLRQDYRARSKWRRKMDP
jgi:membrane protein YdbS with pleckstrin-like domain